MTLRSESNPARVLVLSPGQTAAPRRVSPEALDALWGGGAGRGRGVLGGGTGVRVASAEIVSFVTCVVKALQEDDLTQEMHSARRSTCAQSGAAQSFAARAGGGAGCN